MNNELTIKSTWIKRFYAWMTERFPLANGILFFVLYLTAVALGRTFIDKDVQLFQLVDIFGCIASWTFFLILRIYDEHKDYEIDCENYPDRILQRGLISLKDLKIIGAICIVFQFGYSVYLDQGFGLVTLTWILLTIYSLLMAAEFFVGEWLSKNLILYAVSHMVIMPMIIYWFVALGIGKSPFILEINLFALLSFVSGFAFEITRKTRPPEEEREKVDSYSKIMGIIGCVTLISALLITIGILGDKLVSLSTFFPFMGRLIYVIAIFIAILHLIYFSIKPSIKGREINESLVGMAMLSTYGVLIWALFRGLS